MKKNVKRILLVAASILFVGALAFYLYSKKHKELETTTNLNLKGYEFDLSMVKTYLKNANPADKKEGNMFFFKAIEAFKNNKDYAMADSLFAKSVLKYPNAQTYFEWGKLCAASGNKTKAVQAFEMSESLVYENPQALFWELCKAYQAIKQYNNAEKCLIASIETGLVQDSLFSKSIDSLSQYIGMEKIETLYQTYGEQGGYTVEEQNFKNFGKLFKILKFPLEWKQTAFTEDYENSTQIGFEFEKYVPEMRHAERYTRMVGMTYVAKGKFKIDSNYTGIVVKVMDYLSAPNKYQLVLSIFNSDGKIIDKKIIGGLKNLTDYFVTVEFLDNSRFKIKHYSHKDSESEVLIKDFIKEEFFEINKYGKIVAKTVAS